MKKLTLILSFSMLILSSCKKKDDINICNGETGLSGTMYRDIALKNFPVCGIFSLHPNPDIIKKIDGEERVVGKKYIFENTNEPDGSVFYVKGELHISRKDAKDYRNSGFTFQKSQIAYPPDGYMENDDLLIQLIFAKESNNPGHLGPIQYISWGDWEIVLEKAVSTDKIKGSFKTTKGVFWIPGPASNSSASLDIQFEMR